MSTRDEFEQVVVRELRKLKENDHAVEQRIADLRRQADAELSRLDVEHADRAAATKEVYESFVDLRDASGGMIRDLSIRERRPAIKSRHDRVASGQMHDLPFKVEGGAVEISFVWGGLSWLVFRDWSSGVEIWRVHGDGPKTEDPMDHNFCVEKFDTTQQVISYFTESLARRAAHARRGAAQASAQRAKKVEEERVRETSLRQAEDPKLLERMFSKLDQALAELPLKSDVGRVKIREKTHFSDRRYYEVELPARKKWWFSSEFRQGDYYLTWKIWWHIDVDQAGDDHSKWDLHETLSDMDRISELTYAQLLEDGDGVRLTQTMYTTVDELMDHLRERIESEFRRRRQ